MSLFPIFVKLEGRLVVVIGGGSVAEGKIPSVLSAGARVRLVAPSVTPQIAEWVRLGKIDWLPKEFEAADLNGAFLVIAATSAPGVNEAVFREAEARGLLCNAVDDIEHCHFYYGAVVQRGDLQIAISTNGNSPALAQRLRKELELELGPEYEVWVQWLGAAREALRARGPSSETTKKLLHVLASRPMFEEFLQSQSATGPPRSRVTGRVYLIGAGLGDPELLTLKAARLLQQADVVLHDSLVSREVLARISTRAEVIDVGKRCGRKLLTQDEINALLVSYAASRQVVVRLKGGDPSIFGRAGEELEALRKASVGFEVVPGVTAALGAAAAAGISLTDRRVASQVLLSTFSRGLDANAMDWGCLTPATTLVLYMPGPDYAEVARRLAEAGLAADLPCVIVSGASGSQQQVRWSSVGALSAQEELPAPALMIVGRVAAQQIREIGEAFWRSAPNAPASRPVSVS
jgi:uroporphyrin-III C-methyltransferase/precorrin-2 dehydrogenase/sirohydrochlorin ferrochelatase